MPCIKGILHFTMAVIMLSSSRVSPEAFSEMDAASGAVSESTIRFGELLIGAPDAVFVQGSAELSDEYQSNEERFHLAKAKLQRLGCSVQCGNDSMTLRVPGSRMPHFLVDQGDRSLVPLSEMPASCGFSLKRVRRDVSLTAPYQGCHVRKEGGSYVLPLIIMGAPVKMSCPVSPRLPTVSCLSSGMIISLGVRADDVNVQVDGSWEPLLLIYSKCSFILETVAGSLVVTAPFTGSCWEKKDMDMQLPLMYGDREVTLSCPVTQPMLAPTTIAPTVAVVQDQIDSPQMFYPFPYGRPWWYDPYSHGVQPVPPIAPPTTTTTIAPTVAAFQDQIDSPQMFYPFPFGRPWWYDPYSHGVQTVPPTVPLTTTTSPPLKDQQMFPQMYPMFYPHYFNSIPFPEEPQPQQPRYPMFPPYMYNNPPATTTTSTTTATLFKQIPGYPMYQKFYGPQPFVPPGVQYPFMPKYP